MNVGPRLTQNFIAGTFRDAQAGEVRPNFAPATGEKLGDIVESQEADVREACDAALAAAPAWAAMSVDERRRCMLAWADAVLRRAPELARVDAVDSGTPLRTMRVGVTKGAEYIEYYAGLGMQIQGTTIPATPQTLHYTVKEPYGAVGVIIPFNHPSLFAMSKTAPALMAGNTVVLKPAEQTPVSASLIAEASAEALPPGVLNVVHGGAEVGRSLVAHRKIRRIHFTGGVPTGLAVQAGAAASGIVKNVSMELGGKNPLIVFPDADPATAATAAVIGMNFTRNQGQSCGSTSRLFVHTSIAADVTDRVCEGVRQIRMGLPEDDATEMGSLVSAEHRDRVLGLIDAGRREGAKVLVGGKPGTGELADGAFVQPTVFGGVTSTMQIAQEEIFGPVLSIIEWDDHDRMVEMVNSTHYGLTTAIYTENLTTALRTSAAVEAGFVWINGVETRWKGVPFGGYKNSGLGSEHSIEEMESYTQTKVVNVFLDR